MRVYIAGPYGDSNTPEVIHENVRRADRVSRVFMRLGHEVYCPHKMSWGWEKDTTLSLDDFERLDSTFLTHWATHIYRIPGASKGSDDEVSLAASFGISIIPENYIHLELVDKEPNVC